VKERQGFPKYLVIQEWSLTHTAEYGRGTPLNKANRDESLETSIIPGRSGRRRGLAEADEREVGMRV